MPKTLSTQAMKKLEKNTPDSLIENQKQESLKWVMKY
jgi:hypothetical protein